MFDKLFNQIKNSPVDLTKEQLNISRRKLREEADKLEREAQVMASHPDAIEEVINNIKKPGANGNGSEPDGSSSEAEK